MMSPSDESRVEELYRREFAQYVRVASSITRDAEVSRDVVQEAFARSLQKAGGLVDERALAAWVWRTVIRLAVERSRQEQRSFPELVMPDVELPERDPALARAVRALPARRRLLVFLRYYADLSYAEIAAAAGVSEGTVAATLAQARESLLAALEKEPRS
jgi:RNA polymerase sigma factor (sigma-70 family)